MAKNAINEVVKLYEALHYFTTLSKTYVMENCTIYTARHIFSECKELTKFAEQLEIMRLTKILLSMHEFLSAISQYKAFKCCCKDTMRYIELYNKARLGFRDTLPELEEDVQKFKGQLLRTLDGIHKSHSKPLDMSVYEEKKEAMVSLVQMINEIKDKYQDYDKYFDRLFHFLNIKKKKHGNGSDVIDVDIESNIKYIIQEEDDEFVNNIIDECSGRNGQVLDEEMRKVLDKAVREVIDNHCARSREVQSAEEQEPLFDNFDTLYSNLNNMIAGVRQFQNLCKFTKLEELQTHIVKLQELKIIFSPHE